MITARSAEKSRKEEKLAEAVAACEKMLAIERQVWGDLAEHTIAHGSGLGEFAFRTGGALFLGCIRGRSTLQFPEGRLNICRNALAFLVDRRPLRGQNLPVFFQALKLFQHFIRFRKRDMRLNVVLEDFLKLLPFRRASHPGCAMDKLSGLGQRMMEAALFFVPLNDVRSQGM